MRLTCYLNREELARLLATATDEDRREVIRKAMSALDTHERTVSPDRFNHALNPSVHASVYLGHNVSQVEQRNFTFISFYRCLLRVWALLA
jgi:hypothetical protein